MSEWLNLNELPKSKSNRGYFTEQVIEEFKDNPGKYRKVDVSLATVDKWLKENAKGEAAGFKRHAVGIGSEKRKSKTGKDYSLTKYEVYVAYDPKNS